MANHDLTTLQATLVQRLKEGGAIQSRVVENAFQSVQRHQFLPGVELERVYSDTVIPTKRDTTGDTISSSSQPAIMAIMLEQLGLKAGQRVLEIGSGTGYNAALMAHIVGRRGQIYSLELDSDLAASARQHLTAAGVENVKVINTDGVAGYPAHAPYDRIILTVSTADISPTWREQLSPKGRLVMPLILGTRQVAVAFEHMGDHLRSVSLTPCGFMPMRGAFAPANETVRYDVAPNVEASVHHGVPTSGEAIHTLLTGPYEDIPTVLTLTALQASASALWMELHQDNHIVLNASGAAATPGGLVPYLYGVQGRNCASTGVISEHGLALLTRQPNTPLPEKSDWETAFIVHVRGYGNHTGLVQRLIDQVAKWDAQQQPSTRNMVIRIYPRNHTYEPLPDEVVISRTWNDIIISWTP
ncbi:MAG: hypothetical protein OHK0046_16700 [Anaerolineae bacterium]